MLGGFPGMWQVNALVDGKQAETKASQDSRLRDEPGAAVNP
jgi:hypothetical protein